MQTLTEHLMNKANEKVLLSANLSGRSAVRLPGVTWLVNRALKAQELIRIRRDCTPCRPSTAPSLRPLRIAQALEPGSYVL